MNKSMSSIIRSAVTKLAIIKGGLSKFTVEFAWGQMEYHDSLIPRVRCEVDLCDGCCGDCNICAHDNDPWDDEDEIPWVELAELEEPTEETILATIHVDQYGYEFTEEDLIRDSNWAREQLAKNNGIIPDGLTNEEFDVCYWEATHANDKYNDIKDDDEEIELPF